jgi:predicted metalloprotease
MLAAFLAAFVVIAVATPAALAQNGGSGNEGGDPALDGGGTDATPDKGNGYEATLALAIEDLQNYWADEFPAIYGAKYERIPDDRIIAARPGVELPKCQGQTLTYQDAEDNAFYCYKSNFVAYDDVRLFPQIFRDFGVLAVPLVLAHEWGHAIQDRAGTDGEQTIFEELQADCFAGSWVKRVADGDARGIRLKGGSLDRALAAMLQFRDPTGSSKEDASAHGSGFDRVNAFQQGYDDGAEQCATYFDTNPDVFEIPFTDEQDAAGGGNAPAKDVIPASVEMLNSFYSQVEPLYREQSVDDVHSFDSSASEDELPACGGSTPSRNDIKNSVFYCTDDGYFAFEGDYLQHVYDDIGDFGVTTLLADPFATYVQTLQGFPGVAKNADNARLGADCYTGGFAQALFDELLSSETVGGTVAFSPGDLDETVEAFIDSSAARGVRKDLDVTFARLRAFRDGFFFGYGVCRANYANAVSSLDQPSE